MITEVEGQYFQEKKGVKQDEPLSSILCNSVLEEIFRGLKWGGKKIKYQWDQNYIGIQDFADRFLYFYLTSPTWLYDAEIWITKMWI